MNTVLITGGAGFIGSRLAFGIRESKPECRIIAFDNLIRRGSELNVSRLQEAGIEFVRGDVRMPDELDAIGPVDLIVECSAEPSVLAGYDESPRYVIDTNFGGTVNCLELARKFNAAFLFLSTSRVYSMRKLNALSCTEAATRFVLDEEQSFPGVSVSGISEAFPTDGPRSFYGTSKLCSEQLIEEYADAYGLRTIVNRCGVIAGPWQMAKIDQGLVGLWVSRHYFKGELAYFGYGGEGKQVRDILHVDDLLRLVLHQIDRFEELAGEVFSVGGGTTVNTSLQELTALCEEVTGNTLSIGSESEDRVADVRLYITDHAHVTQRCGWKPETDLRTIVEEVAAWLAAHEKSLRPILNP